MIEFLMFIYILLTGVVIFLCMIYRQLRNIHAELQTGWIMVNGMRDLTDRIENAVEWVRGKGTLEIISKLERISWLNKKIDDENELNKKYAADREAGR